MELHRRPLWRGSLWGTAALVLSTAAQAQNVSPATVTLGGDAPHSADVQLDTGCSEDAAGRQWRANVYPRSALVDWLDLSTTGAAQAAGVVDISLFADLAQFDADATLVTVTFTSTTDCAGQALAEPLTLGTLLITVQTTADDEDPEDPVDPQDPVGPDDGDFDADGISNAEDNCPQYANAGQFDTDLDGIGDPCDGCPLNSDKQSPGDCGCEAPDEDSDGDGLADCIDGCPDHIGKQEPGVCGCFIPELDADDDGTPDCADGCPTDPSATEPGPCGCGVVDEDLDFDGVSDCADDCPLTPFGDLVDDDGCGPGQRDRDRDGLPDLYDDCPDTPKGQPVDLLGCAVFELDTDTDGINDAIDQCPWTLPGLSVDERGCEFPEFQPPEIPVEDPRCSNARGGRNGDPEPECPVDVPDADRQTEVDAGLPDADASDAGAAACGAGGTPLLSSLLLTWCGHGLRRRRRRNSWHPLER